jgi:hypothetical protein
MHSWEIGTLAEALTELEWCQLGVFYPGSIPPPAKLNKGEVADVLHIAEQCAGLFFAYPPREAAKICVDATCRRM